MARCDTFIAALLALTIAGCTADQGQYPSLARRPAERVSGSIDPAAPPPPPATPAPPSPELVARLDQLTAQAREAHTKFQSREGKAQQLTKAAEGAALASENWAVATIAVADLESARSEAMIALAEVDQLQTAAIVEGKDAAAITAARQSIIALVSEEDSVLANLRDRLAN